MMSINQIILFFVCRLLTFKNKYVIIYIQDIQVVLISKFWVLLKFFALAFSVCAFLYLEYLEKRELKKWKTILFICILVKI